MRSDAKIVVTSRTFCEIPSLCEELIEVFPNTTLNTSGAFFKKFELIEYLKEADGVLLGTETMDREVIDATYAFARKPDITLYFDVPVEVGLERILKGRPELKYYEAGLDMQWTFDPVESYTILQTKIKAIYDQLAEEGTLVKVDATKGVSKIQKKVRKILQEKIDFSVVEPIYPSDRLAEQQRGTRLEWLEGLSGEVKNDD